MNKIVFFLSFLQFFVVHSLLLYSQDYSEEDLNAVYLLDEGKVEIQSVFQMDYTVRKRIKILNEDGLGHAVEYVYYDNDDRKISYFDAAIVDDNGEVIEKLKKSEIKDKSTYDGFSVYQDNRMKIADLRRYTYPYIVEFSYQLEFNNIFLIPDWYFTSGSDTYTVKSVFSIKSPSGLGLLPRYKLKNGVEEPVKSMDGAYEVLTWKKENLRSIENEILSGTYISKVPSIILAPNDFVYGGIPGSMNSWDEFGEWFLQVNHGRDSLSNVTIQKLKDATAGMDDIQKIKHLYEYLQNKTRYVSIQLGFGGLQPFPAYTVEDTGYGDCKALSNYMYAMLKVVDVNSNYTLVEADDNPRELYDDFVYDPFNHVILSVPLENDTIWLECTSQRIPFGFLGSFTSDREVLMITNEGGKVVRTPKYDSNWNQYSSKTIVKLNTDNTANVEISSSYTGLLTERSGLRGIVHSGEDEKKKWLLKNLDQSDLSMDTWEIKYNESEIPEIAVNASFGIRSIGRKSGTRIFISPNLFNKSSLKLKAEEERQYDIIINESYIESDSVQIDLGTTFPEKIPQDVTLESEFGKYETHFIQNENILIFVRKLTVKEGRFSPDKYEAFISFVNAIYKKDRTRIVLRSKT